MLFPPCPALVIPITNQIAPVARIFERNTNTPNFTILQLIRFWLSSFYRFRFECDVSTCMLLDIKKISSQMENGVVLLGKSSIAHNIAELFSINLFKSLPVQRHSMYTGAHSTLNISKPRSSRLESLSKEIYVHLIDLIVSVSWLNLLIWIENKFLEFKLLLTLALNDKWYSY